MIVDKILKFGCYLLLTITLSFYAGVTFGQDIKSLEEEINNSKKQIEKANEMLKSNKNQENANVEQLSLIRSQMTNRKKIVANMNKQSNIINSNIRNNNGTVDKLKKEYQSLRKEYSDMMIMGYKNFLFSNTLLFLFAAKDFNELQMRVYYIRRYSNLRYKLSVEIDNKADEIANQNDSLKIKQGELRKVSDNTKVEIKSLEGDSKRYNKTLETIKNDRKKLNADIKRNQDNIKKLQSKIQQIIAEEARKERERQRKAPKATQEKYVAESSEFSKWRGKLNSPSEKGIMVEGFGIHAHPIQKKLSVENKGVNIQVPQNSKVRCVFDGIVTKIFFHQGLNNTVMVRHGEYITTYSGLTEVAVQVGDIVSRGESLGSISGESTTLHFELWKGTQNLNPELWLNF